MPQFKNKKISLNSEDLAEQLNLARKKTEKSLDEVARELNINIEYLEALENANFHTLPEGVYGRNFLKEYSDYLNLDTKEFLELFDSEIKKNINNPRELFVQKVSKPHYFLSIPKLIKNLLIALVIILCLSYIAYYINNIISPPTLTITYPVNDINTKEYTITIRGNTEETAEVEINGQKILLQNEGDFEMPVKLKKGLNTITIISKKKYSKENIITRKIILDL